MVEVVRNSAAAAEDLQGRHSVSSQKGKCDKGNSRETPERRDPRDGDLRLVGPLACLLYLRHDHLLGGKLSGSEF